MILIDKLDLLDQFEFIKLEACIIYTEFSPNIMQVRKCVVLNCNTLL